MDDEIVKVKLNSHYRNLFPGEEAGFPKNVADDLVEKKIASYVENAKQEAPQVTKQATPQADKQASGSVKK